MAAIDAPAVPAGEVCPYAHYPTPQPLADAIVEQIVLPKRLFWADWYGGCALDPGAGGGAFGTALRKFRPNINLTGVELRDVPDPGYGDWANNQDYLEWYDDYTYNLVIGNPPFNKAEEFVRASRKRLCSRGKLVFLLRLAFLETATRWRGLYQEYKPEEVWVLVQRPSFKANREGKNATDTIPYGVFVWGAESASETTIHWLDWKGKK